MSRVQVGGADLCDNLPSPDALTAQTRNFNETNALASLSPSQKQEGGGLIQRTSVNNNGKEEEQQGKEGYTTRGREEEDEEEDIDEWMKGVEEDEESEGSSGLIRCQSPETPMTDSSYSETGSLLETPYPFSPGTSPEPASPLIPAGCPETAEISQIDVKVDPHNADLVATTLIATSDTNPPGPTCITDKVSANTDVTAGRLASSTESVFSSGPTCVRGFPSTAETFTVPACTAMLNPAIASTPMSATAKPLTLTAWPATPGTDSTATTGAMTSNCDRITSTPVPTGVATCATGPPPRPALLESLEELAQRGDDTHLPLYLHQIAEAFVLHKDYQRALWCIQLERLYHQRVLDNLNALQQQWGSQCSSSFFDPATQHLDTLKNLCRTHRRPGPRDAVCASLDLLRPTFEEGSALSLFTSVHRVDEGMEQKAPNPSHYQSSHVPSFNLTGGLHSPEISEKARSGPGKEVEGGVCFHGDQVTDKHSGQRAGGEEGGGVEYATSVRGNGLHPSTAGIIDQSKPAEPQGGDLGPTRGKEAKREVKEAAEALEMEDEEGEDEQEKSVCQKALPVDTLASGADVELHHEAPAEEKLHEEIQESPKTCLHQETRLPQEAHTNQHEQDEEVKEGDDEDDEEEEEEEYNEVEQVDVIKEASSLDDMAKLITVEEVSPASGLVSILKKRRVCVDTISMSTSTETRPDKIPAKRRVRFKAPDDGYDQDVGGGDSCLLLFLLCLVTVVISVGGTALYCALGDTHSSVCQDFSRNADFYIGQLQSGIAQLRLWFAPGS